MITSKRLIFCVQFFSEWEYYVSYILNMPLPWCQPHLARHKLILSNRLKMETLIKCSFAQRLQLSTEAILMIGMVKGNNKPFIGFPLIQQMLGKTSLYLTCLKNWPTQENCTSIKNDTCFVTQGEGSFVWERTIVYFKDLL